MTDRAEFDAACEQWTEFLGADAVMRSPGAIRHAARTTLPDAPAPLAILKASSTEQVVAAVDVASRHRVPLYPISRGRNWGWGDACPPTTGQVLLDLSGMDHIITIDEELGYTVVQPGVTQGQLAGELARRGSAWRLDWTAAGPDTSIVGNALERGITAHERIGQVAGMQVVLADGTLVRTGYGHFPATRVGHLSHWGIGPALDGLFSQSNLGIVTELGFWLQPKPEHAELGYFCVAHDALATAIDALRPLRQREVIGGQPIFRIAGSDGRQLWFGVAVLQGQRDLVAAHRRLVLSVLSSTCRVAFCPTEGDPCADDMAAALGLPPLPGVLDRMRRANPLAAPPFTPESVLEFVGGPAIQHSRGTPVSADPRDNDYGFSFAWLSCPAVGREVRRLIDLVHDRLAEYEFPSLLSLRFATGRAIVLVLRIAFDPRIEERRLAARACQRAILTTAIAAGYPPARVSIDAMDLLDPAGSTYWEIVRRIKDALDPDGILAPGRYSPWY